MKKIILPFIVLSLMLDACQLNKDCYLLADKYRNERCALILSKVPDGTAYFKAEGIDLDTRKKIKYNHYTRWWNIYSNKMELGDTIIKRKGELVFSIHKKDTVLRFNWECDGKIYK
ncbi:hypothetical protein CHU92_00120 [Flavobacterium cyanobacteriorum]|uniref:Uncharacterized protein n=1 Tax=Flavobacterium cyanobacteriorum TaxID=2022802 RepID=A0A256A9V0_9FLAO|nr:hypothetical protein [Flavobacterium cyanobacteriorum]OYQ50369.1 hypothetical protein CHU92_00120 [Flavobacterium cyanobacteriorum]